MKTPEYQQVSELSSARHPGFWSDLGGGALTFAILFHIVVLLAGAIWVFQITRVPAPKHEPFYQGTVGGHEGQANPQVTKNLRPHPQVVPAADLTRIVAKGATGLVIPNIDQSFGNMDPLPSIVGGGGGSGGGGSGTGNGPSVGSGSDLFNGHGPKLSFKSLPLDFTKRCSKTDRLARLTQTGGSTACENAVVKGLLWLKAHQSSDGSWGTTHQTAMTGLALLAYFGHCETPESEEFGDSCLRGITFLVDVGLKHDGKLVFNTAENSWPYEHAIATYALAEAATFCKEIKYQVPNLMAITEKAGQFIIDNQNKNGGWAYQYATYDGHVDLSVTGWQIQALKACSHTGIKYRGMPGCIERALRFVATCQNSEGAYGYTGANNGARDGYYTLTGVGMLCNQMWGKGRGEARKASRYVLKNTKFDYNSEFADLYGHYYESQAMMQLGGGDWVKYNAMFRDQLLNNQDADGSWKPPGGGKQIRAAAAEYVGNQLYRTCLCSLMLEVYYRFLSTGGGNTREPSGV